MRYRFLTVDVFTERRFGGNQLAVLPDARGLDAATMQAIAREFNFSETVFVLPPEDPAHTRKVRIFTPATELPFAGHPTVGCAIVLAIIGELELPGGEARIVLEEGVGPVPVTIQLRDGQPMFARLSAAHAPEQGPPPPPRDALAAMLSLETKDVLDDAWRPEAWSTGTPFLFVTVPDRAALGRARPRIDVWETTLGNFWTHKVMVLCRDPELSGSDLRARMFAPLIGITEDPATGSAAAALPGYLAGRLAPHDGTGRWIMEQGFEMGRPSIIEVAADYRDGKAVASRVGGAAVLVSEGIITTGG